MSKKEYEVYEGKPVLVAADKKKLEEAVKSFNGELTAPYIVRIKTKRVEGCAFMGEESLGVVLLNDNVKVIDTMAFKGCTGLTGINIPESVTKIEWKAFEECTSLTNIKFPASLCKLECAFEHCSSLSGIEVAEGNPVFRSEGNALIKNDVLILGGY